MKQSKMPKTVCRLSDSTARMLDSYALAATAFGVSVLALAPASEAKIIYTPTHHVVKEGGQYKLDLNSDGVIDFTIQAKYTQTTSGFFEILSAVPAAGNGVQGWTGYEPWAFALKSGQRIGSQQYFPAKVLADYGTLAGSGHPSGSWVNVNKRYLGLKFKIKGKIHYGWARMNLSVNRTSITGTLTGYAYETVVQKPIKAGQTKDSSDESVQPKTVGQLAKGATSAQK